MIDSIVIKNHETHVDTTIENLHKGVNVLTGESDDGKSSIVRAITWNAKNRPRGDSYRNDQLDPKNREDRYKKTAVSIYYKGTGLVSRVRDGFGGGINHYRIDKEGPLRALRTDVPDEVREVTRMKDVNIQGQHPSEQYFLLADKPGQVAKELNKVAGLTIMDKALADINSQVRECNSAINVSKKEIEEKEEELKETEWIPKAEKFAKKLQGFLLKINKVHQEEKTIRNILFQISIVEDNLTHFEDVEVALSKINSLSKEKEIITVKDSELKSIQHLVIDIKSVDLELANCLHTDLALNELKTLEKSRLDIDKKVKLLDTINDLVLDLSALDKEIHIAEDYHKKALKVYNNLRETTECPTCGRTGK